MVFRDFSIIMLHIFYEIKYKTVNASEDQGDRITSGPSPTWKKPSCVILHAELIKIKQKQ